MEDELDADIQKNIRPLVSSDPLSHYLVDSNNSFTKASSSVSNSPKPTPSFAPNMEGMAAAGAANALGTVGAAWINGGFDIGKGFIAKSAAENVANISASTQFAAIKLQRDMFNREWDSARKAGLYSPAQFGMTGGGGYFRGSSFGSIPAFRLNAPQLSPFH